MENNNNIINNNEVLFWKVIHNKYIFRIIISLIPITINELFNEKLKINYNDYNVINNRCKFKYIHSLKWMIKNNQLQLIKCKLIANEYIQINKKSIGLLFNLMKKEPIIKNKKRRYYLIEDTYQDNKVGMDDESRWGELTIHQRLNLLQSTSYTSLSSSLLLQEILQLLLDKNRIQIECLVDDIISFAIYCPNAVKILSNQPIPIPIYKSTIDTLKTLYSPHYRNQIIDILVNSNSYKLLDHSLVSGFPQIEEITKEVEEEKNYFVNKSNSNLFEEEPLLKIDYEPESLEWHNQLESGKLIEGISNIEIYEYSLSSFSGNALEYLIKKGEIMVQQQKNISMDGFTYNYISLKTLIKNQDNILKWIKLATTQSIITYGKSKESFNCDVYYLICKFSNISKEWYYNAIETLNNSGCKYIFPPWNQNLHAFVRNDGLYNCKYKIFVVKDVETIDWMVSTVESNFFNYLRSNTLYFQSIQLIDYIKPHLESLGLPDSLNYFFNKLYKTAVQQCNVQIIKELDSRSDIKFKNIHFKQIDFYRLFKNNPIEKVEQLLNHWYSNNYKPFSEKRITFNMKQSLYLLIERVIYEQRNCKDGDQHGIEVLKRIKLNLNLVNKEVINQILIPLIKINDFKSISLVFNHHQFKLDNSFFTNFNNNWDGEGEIKPWKYLYDSNLNVYTIDNIDSNELISYVNFWIDQLISYTPDFNGNGNDNCEIEVKRTFSVILNHLYSTLLQIKSIKIQDIKLVRQMLFENSIEIDHSYFHSFIYLFIKSTLLIKFLMKANDIRKYNNNNDYYENCSYFKKEKTSKLYSSNNQEYFNCNVEQSNSVSCLNVSQFTFDYLFCQQSIGIDDILLELFIQSVTINEEKEYTLSEIARFLLEIGKFDLIFRHCQQIKQLEDIKYLEGNDDLLITGYRHNQLEFVFKSYDIELIKELSQHEDLGINKHINLNYCLYASLVVGDLEIVKLLFENYYQTEYWEYYVYNRYNLNSIEYIFSNYGDKVFLNDRAGNINNIFKKSFIDGNILLCDLFLKYYSKQIIISNKLISKALKSNKINIIKYYYQNGLIKSDDQLTHLKNTLLLNDNFKNPNWFKFKKN